MCCAGDDGADVPRRGGERGGPRGRRRAGAERRLARGALHRAHAHHAVRYVPRRATVARPLRVLCDQISNTYYSRF